ncbi:MAG: hemerythrin domain-containing protein [Pirellulaceae bacterium]|nr:hypothetical protein [Planctomycetales bacterium]
MSNRQQLQTDRRTATRKGVVTINAAFLREIKEDNRELHQLLERTRYLTEPSLGRPLHANEVRGLVKLLSRLKDRLAMHFALEEAYGYFEDAVTAAPRLTVESEMLRAEHGPLFIELCHIVEYSEPFLYREAATVGVSELCTMFTAFHQRFYEHEQRETELILAAFDDDLGCGD